MCRCLPCWRIIRRIGLIMKIKFTLIDYIIILLVICAIAFAFIHITTDDSSDLQKTAFDESTISKIPDTYSKYYKDGYIVKTTINGFNSTNGEETTLEGDVIWEDENSGNAIKLLVESDNQTYLVGQYKNLPTADIYIDQITLESNGEKYDNLCEIQAKPMEITSIKDITDKIPENTDYELTTILSLDSLDSIDAQKILNKISSHDKRSSIKTENSMEDNQLIIKRATDENLNDVDSILGSFTGITDEITIRIYDCTDSQIDEISKNFDIINIRKF